MNRFCEPTEPLIYRNAGRAASTNNHLPLRTTEKAPSDDSNRVQAQASETGLTKLARERNMTRERLALSIAFSVVATTALPIASAEAHGWQLYAPYASQTYFAYPPIYRSHFIYHPSVVPAPVPAGYGPFNGKVGYYGSGTFSNGRRIPGTNYNPNQ
jgi:hypothetical protein